MRRKSLLLSASSSIEQQLFCSGTVSREMFDPSPNFDCNQNAHIERERERRF